jgi:hypothetical protein
MNDVVGALAVSAGILSPVVILTIIISIVTVKRGEAEMRGAHHRESAATAEAAAAPAPAVKAVKPAAPAVEEINVGQILLYGLGLFTVTILALLGLSLIEHLN